MLNDTVYCAHLARELAGDFEYYLLLVPLAAGRCAAGGGEYLNYFSFKFHDSIVFVVYFGCKDNESKFNFYSSANIIVGFSSLNRCFKILAVESSKL